MVGPSGLVASQAVPMAPDEEWSGAGETLQEIRARYQVGLVAGVDAGGLPDGWADAMPATIITEEAFTDRLAKLLLDRLPDIEPPIRLPEVIRLLVTGVQPGVPAVVDFATLLAWTEVNSVGNGGGDESVLVESSSGLVQAAILGIAGDPEVVAWALVDSSGQLARCGIVHLNSEYDRAKLQREIRNLCGEFGPFTVAVSPGLDITAPLLEGLTVRTVSSGIAASVPAVALARRLPSWPLLEMAAAAAVSGMDEASGPSTQVELRQVENGRGQAPVLSVSSPSPIREATRPRPQAVGRRGGRWLTVGELMDEYGLSRAAVYRLPVRHFTPVGRRRRYLREDLERHFRSTVHQVVPPASAPPRPSPRDSDQDLQAEWDELADRMGL